ncbi:hypothetical protein DL768_011077 [Monosporascus sp. mg162]|nr:hypothetical protein DL768_011077 [Monosporascus sp. mg162]
MSSTAGGLKPTSRSIAAVKGGLKARSRPLTAAARTWPSIQRLGKGASGFEATALRDGNEWVINGEKMWATNCAGWDFKGCDLACVVCRDITDEAPKHDSDPKDYAMIILVTRADLDSNGEGACEVLRHISMPGHTTCSARQDRALRLPFGLFDASAVLVCAMGVGLMRAAFDAALAFAKRDSRNGAKAAHATDNDPGDYDARRELALAARVYCSDAAVKACMDAINAVGITAYDLSQPLAELLNSAMVLAIFDDRNVGTRRRHMQQLMLSPSYDAWAATYGASEKQ